MNGLSTSHWLASSKMTLRAAVATMLVFGRMAVAALHELARTGQIGMVRARAGAVQGTTDTRRALGRLCARSQAAVSNGAAALGRHRHGTWLVLFALLFTGLWLLAGWIGMGNGVLRGLLVGVSTPLLVDRLFPLKRTSR